MIERAVIGLFGFFGKTAAGELAAFQVITDAVTAHPLPGAGIISALAGFQVFFLFALHFVLLFILILQAEWGKILLPSFAINVL